MRTRPNSALVLPMVLSILGSMPVAAEDREADTGKREFVQKCASCHGADGKGQGPIASFLTPAPTDLTTLSQKNGGIFPYLHVEAVIDGRDVVKVHGPRDMPVWGTVYLKEGDRAKARSGGGPADTALYAHLRILALMDYVHRIQQK